ncbi:hypothetical protein QVA66_04690 [Staphylococcus chromogenes]|nr:hypothetical protein [Staphylococcus chromogenes]
MLKAQGLRNRATTIAIASFSAVSLVLSPAAVPMATAQEVTDINPSEVKVVDDPAAKQGTVNGVTIDKETGEVVGPDALDTVKERSAQEQPIIPNLFATAPTLDELPNTSADTGIAHINVIESKGKLVCELSGSDTNKSAYLDLKIKLAKSFFDAGNALLSALIKAVPLAGDLLSGLLQKFGSQTVWPGIEKLVREGEANKTQQWDLVKAQNMAITKIDNADAQIDLENADVRKETLSGFLKFADTVFGTGAKTIVKLFNIAVTIAGFVGVPGINGLKLSEAEQNQVLDSITGIRDSSADLAEANAEIGQTCTNLLTGKEAAPTEAPTPTAKPTSAQPTSAAKPSTVQPAPSEPAVAGKDS